MNLNLFLFYFAYILNLLNYIPNLLASPIIGGEEDTFHTHKYHVSIQHKYDPINLNSAQHFCGGTIIHDRYVLSVAHPFLRMENGRFVRVINPKSENVVVLSGTSETYGAAIITIVDQIFIPHEFTLGPPKVYGDISVLKLSHDLYVERNEDRLQILPMEEGNNSLDFYVNKNAVIVGNGCDTFENGQPVRRAADRRQVLHVHMSRRSSCPEFDFAICAQNLDTSRIRTSCYGDSGSPIVFDNTVIGVLSEGPEYCHYNGPIVFMRTSTFIHFIRNAMNEYGNHSQMYILED